MSDSIYGVDDLSLDAKMRVSIPAYIRKETESESMNILAVPGKYPHIDFFPEEEIFKQEVCSRRADMSKYTPANILQVLFNGNSDKVVIDKQGRTNAIPQRLLRAAKIQKNVVIMGNGTYFSMYDQYVYEELMDEAARIMVAREEALNAAVEKDNAALADGSYLEFPSNGGTD